MKWRRIPVANSSTPKKTHYKERDVILDSITEGVFTVDPNWRITSFNRAAEEITGIPRAKAVGRHCSDILRADVCETGCALRETMETGRPIINRAVHIIHTSGNRKAISISTALLKDGRNNVIGGVETFRDMSLIEELRKVSGVNYKFPLTTIILTVMQ